MNPAELPNAWRARAVELEPYCASAAEAFRAAAGELESALRGASEAELTLDQASEESNYSKRRLRELIADGSIPNAGRKHAPRIRRADLPRKHTKTIADGFDASAEARRLLA